MKIAVIDSLTHTYTDIIPSGIARAAVNDYEILKNDHEVKLYHCGKPYCKDSVILNDLSIKERLIKTNKDDKGILTKVYLTEYSKGIKEHDAYIIHIHNIGHVDFLLKRFADKPKVFIVHDIIYDRYSLISMLWTLSKIKHSNKSYIVTNSNYSLNRHKNSIEYFKHDPTIKTLCSKDKYNLVIKALNGRDSLIDKSFKYFVYVDNEFDKCDNKNYLCNIGRFDPDRGANRLIKIIPKINKDIYFFGQKDIYRDKNFEFYNKLIENKLNIFENLSDSELHKYIKESSGTVITMTKEGFGYTGIETARYGLPVFVIEANYDEKFKTYNQHATYTYLKNLGYKSLYLYNISNYKEKIVNDINTLRINDDLKCENYNLVKNYFTLENAIKERELFIDNAKHNTIKSNSDELTLF